MLHIWAFDPDMKLIHYKEHWKPSLYKRATTEEINTNLKSLEGYQLRKVEYNTLWDMTKDLKDINAKEALAVKENGFVPPEIPKIAELFPVKPEEPIRPRRLYFDIEVFSERGFPTPDKGIWPITSCGFWRAWDNVMKVYGCKPLTDEQKANLPDDAIFIYCKDEISLIASILHEMTEGHVLLGWNSNQYDFPYIQKRCDVLKSMAKNKKHPLYPVLKLGLAYVSDIKDMSTFKKFDAKENRNKFFTKIPGKGLLDVMELYQKFTRISLPSYSLDNVGKFEFGEGKLKAYGDGGNKELNLVTMFKHHWETYVTYNIRDVRLTADIDIKRSLTELSCEMSSLAGIPVDRVVYMSAILDGALVKFLRDRDFVAPGHFVSGNLDKIKGGFVKKPIAVWGRRFYKHTTCVDVTSSYPTGMVCLNMSPETFVGTLDLPEVFEYQIPPNDDGQPTLLNRKAALADDILDLLPTEGEVGIITQLATHRLPVADVRKKFEDMEWNVSGDGTISMNPTSDGKKGVFSSFIEEGFATRKALKRKFQKHRDAYEAAGYPEDSPDKLKMDSYNTGQLGWKLLLNSSYGQLASRFNRLYNPLVAQGITSTGQSVVLQGERYCNEFFTHIYKEFVPALEEVLKKHGKPELSVPFWDTTVEDRVCTMDTDSFIFTLDDMVETVYPGSIGDYEQLIKDVVAILVDGLNVFLNGDYKRKRLRSTSDFPIQFEHEAEKTSNGSMFMGKKKYLVRRPDGKLKITGFELKKVNMSEGIREELQALVDHLFEEGHKLEMYDGLCHFLNRSKALVTALKEGTPQEVAMRLSYSTSVNNLEKYTDEGKGIFGKGSPIHVKGSLIHNRIIKEQKLNMSEIYTGDRVRCLKIKPPVPKWTSICFKEELPIEMAGLEPDVAQIVKVDFIQKGEKLLGAFGWESVLTNLMKHLNKAKVARGWMEDPTPFTVEEIVDYCQDALFASNKAEEKKRAKEAERMKKEQAEVENV